MKHQFLSLPGVAALLAFASTATAQMVVTTNTTTDTIVGFSPVDGSLISTNVFPVQDTVQTSAIAVGTEIWVSEQTGDRVVRYDHSGNIVGVIGPTLPGGGLDNIRNMTLISGVVYVTNDGANNGATADSLVMLDTAGNYLGTLPLSNTVSPWCVLPWQGDMLVSTGLGTATTDDVHRYTLGGVSVGTFNNSTLDFLQQISQASDGNVWAAVFTSDVVAKLDATTGAVISSFPATDARGVFELQNGNILWTGSGVWIHDVTTNTNTQVLAGGSSYQLSLIPTDVSYNRKVGAGCHSFVADRSNLFQLYPDVPSTKLALDGNALHFALTANGYVANWLPGAAASLYTAPTPGATIIANADSTNATFSPSAPIPVPGGTESVWTVSPNGILTAGTPGNQTTSSTATLSATATATRLAFYTWCNHNPAETGSGKIKWEEVGGKVLLTWDAVEFSGGTPTLSPSTFQFQLDMTTGDVTLVWLSFSNNTSTADVLIGCTLAGAGLTPVSQTLQLVSGVVLSPDVPLTPMTLAANPAPIINPSSTVNYTIGNIPETAPGSGLYLSTLVLSVAPVPGGIDLTGILTSAPGCNLYVGTLDVIIGTAITVTPTNVVPVTFSTPLFAPGNTIGAQGVGFFDAAFPLVNGETSGLLFSNGVVSATFAQ
ncbi:MAG: hypothetical protein JNK78_20530 [Planctomycetes bacterium]|nr:hypothetical protein [Planctomycetota bacterium]